jgi:hypothetical protein
LRFNDGALAVRQRKRMGDKLPANRSFAMGRSKCSSAVESQVSTEEIARRAYEIWEARGRPAGDGSEDWDAAVAELSARRDGLAGGLRHWWERMRRSIVGRDS